MLLNVYERNYYLPFESYCRSISFFFWLSLLFLLFFYVFSHQSLSWWYSSDPVWKVQNSVLMKTVVDTCVRGGRKIIEGEENILAGKKLVQPRNILAVGKKIGLRKKLGCGKNGAAEKMGLRKFFGAPMPSQNPGYNTVQQCITVAKQHTYARMHARTHAYTLTHIHACNWPLRRDRHWAQ